MATLLHDVIMAGLAIVLAIAIRTGSFDIPVQQNLGKIGLFVLIASTVNWLVGLNRGVWRYASLPELIAIIKYSVITVFLFTVAVALLAKWPALHWATVVLLFVLLVVMTSALRISYRIMRSRRAVSRAMDRNRKTNALLIGAGDNAELFLKSIGERNDLAFRPLGIIDERRRRIGLSIHGTKVLSGIEDLEDVIRYFNTQTQTPVEAIILTKTQDAISDDVFERIMAVAGNYHVKLLRLPNISSLSLVDGKQSIAPRPVKLEDLLSRPQTELASSSLIDLARNATVLVTGAGGSIGSELCRQILALKPRRLILVDNSEFLLFTIDQELKPKADGTILSARLCDVRDRNRITKLINETRPDLVLHAAALKHVPMVEEQPLEGLLTNVIGTRNVADACMSNSVRAMIMVSTDKAVNPTNVMGASKRLAEMYCQSLDLEQATRFVTVRFGNVLGSAGSVVPIFERQIAEGGPVTVTHPDIERFFMTIPEAVSLILHATGHALHHESERGSIFVLDMGKPVKIADLAHKLIQLSGLRPNVDIKIVYTGLRSGEKLYEELFTDSEVLLETSLPSVKQARPDSPGLEIVSAKIDEVQSAIEDYDSAAAMRILLDSQCRYQPTVETIERLRKEKSQMH